jgi:hypothetical protein
MVKPKHLPNKDALVRLWCHEGARVFKDRLVCMYICVYICVCICIYTYVQQFIYAYMCMHIYTYIHVYIFKQKKDALVRL